MIPKEEVTEEVGEILEEQQTREREFLTRVIPSFIVNLKTHPPDFWKNYGPYWWNLMPLMKEYDPRAFREYAQRAGGEEELGKDDEVKAEYDYGSDMTNWCAAQMYLEMRIESMELGADKPHSIEFKGEDRQYVPGVGFVEETEEPTE